MLLLLDWFIVCGYFSVKEIVLGLIFHINTMEYYMFQYLYNELTI